MKSMESLYSSMRFNFLYIDKYSFQRTWVYPTNKVPYCMIRYIVSGRARFTIDNNEYMVNPGQLVYIPEDSLLGCQALDDDFTFISIRFKPSVHFEGGDFLTDYYGVSTVIDCEDEEVYKYFIEMYNSAISKSKGKMFRIRGNLELLIAYLTEKTTNANVDGTYDTEETPFTLERIKNRAIKTHTKRDARIQVVVDYLVTHPTKNFDADMLSEMADLSKSSLRRLFKEQTGKSASEFLKDIRMMTAARKLLITDQRISNIAYEVGYDDPNYFARTFKEVFGVSPQQYRITARE